MSDTHLHAQRGLSLVELMIGMTVGLVLLAGILQIFIGNKQDFEAQASQAELQENVQLASFLLDRIVGHAGFHANAFDDEDTALSGPAIAATDGSTDRITVRYQSDGAMTDCIGANIGDREQSVNRFFIDNIDSATGLGTLSCTRTRVETDGTPHTSTQPLVDNAQALEIRYGEDTDGDDAVDTYRDAGSVTDWQRVLSVEIAVVLASDNNVRPTGGSQTLTVLGATRTFGDSDDRRQREVVNRVIALRNRLP